jgi:pimeloyl-ACP methyl ester carboxylesterase
MFVRSRRGRGGPPPLVFIHGLGESGLCFDGVLAEPRLERWRRLAPDLPGYGRSAWSDEPLSLPQQADRIADWLATKEEGEAVVVGHSMGGVVALLLAERHPERVAAVIDVEGNKSPPDCVFSGQAAGQDLEAFLTGGFEALIDHVYAQGASDPALRTYYASLRLCDPRAFHRNALELTELSASESLAGRLAELPVPSRYIAGVPGGAAPRSLELLAEAGIPCAEVSPSGHWPFIDRRAAFVETLAKILLELDIAGWAKD